MTVNELYNIFNGLVPVELEHLAKDMQSLSERCLKPTIKSCLGASGSTRYYYVAYDTTYIFDPPCAAVSSRVKINNDVWYIYFRHGNAWLKRDTDWVCSYLSNRPLDHLKPLSTPDELSNFVWSKCGQGIGFDAEGNKSWRLVNDTCYRLFEADKVPDPKEEPKQTKVRHHREPRLARKPRLSKKDVAGPDLKLDF